jgi:hypothetical protein
LYAGSAYFLALAIVKLVRDSRHRQLEAPDA